ncbi:MAG TPA: hypothetical protein VF268_00775 [Gammaproteobacteria bacterium]
MVKKFKYSNIEQSAVEIMAADNLATRVFPGKVNIEVIVAEARNCAAVWRKKDKAAKRALWKMLGAAMQYSLAVRTNPVHLDTLKKKCKKAGISFTKDTPTETLVVKFLFGCDRGLAHKYSAAIRGAILLELMPEGLADRQHSDPKADRLTLKYLIKVLLNSQDKKEGDGDSNKAPSLLWTDKARERFAEVSSQTPRLVCLVKQTDDGYKVTNVVDNAEAVENFLKK